MISSLCVGSDDEDHKAEKGLVAERDNSGNILPLKILIVGAAATGRTTLARYLYHRHESLHLAPTYVLSDLCVLPKSLFPEIPFENHYWDSHNCHSWEQLLADLERRPTNSVRPLLILSHPPPRVMKSLLSENSFLSDCHLIVIDSYGQEWDNGGEFDHVVLTSHCRWERGQCPAAGYGYLEDSDHRFVRGYLETTPVWRRLCSITRPPYDFLEDWTRLCKNPCKDPCKNPCLLGLEQAVDTTAASVGGF